MSPNRIRLKRQKTAPKHQKSPRTPKQKKFQSPATPVSTISSGNSPQFIWQSQDVHDGVTWDYRSPMQKKLRSAKKHGKTSVTELLKCVNNDGEKQQKISLLDTWISAGQRVISPIQCCRRKTPESRRRRLNLQKVRPVRHLAEELQELSEAVNKKDNFKEHEELSLQVLSSSVCSEKGRGCNFVSSNILYKTKLDDNLDSSSEELWGPDSESFLIQATQATEQAEDEYANKQLSQTIPMHVADVNKECMPFKENTHTKVHKMFPPGVKNEKIIRKNQVCGDLQITENTNTSNQNVICHLDTAENFWESDNSLDEVLSSLPCDELAIKVCVEENSKNDVTNNSHSDELLESTKTNYPFSPKAICENKPKKHHEDKFINETRSKTDSNRCLADKNSSLFSAAPSVKLNVDTVEWDSDEFDAVIMQAELLAALEQAESEACGSQMCSPERIARKKMEAMQRRRKCLNAHIITPKQEMVWKDRLRSKTIDVTIH